MTRYKHYLLRYYADRRSEIFFNSISKWCTMSVSDSLVLPAPLPPLIRCVGGETFHAFCSLNSLAVRQQPPDILGLGKSDDNFWWTGKSVWLLRPCLVCFTFLLCCVVLCCSALLCLALLCIISSSNCAAKSETGGKFAPIHGRRRYLSPN